jgi:hypothetical protein
MKPLLFCCTVVLAFCHGVVAGAQSLEWGRQFGTSEAEQPGPLSTDTLGNVYLTGMTTGGLAGPNPTFSLDVYFAKYDAEGALQWTRQLGDEREQHSGGAAADRQGNVFFSGSTVGSFGGPSAGGFDVFIAKYDDAGNAQWMRQLGSSGADQWSSVSTDDLGNVYLGGGTTGNVAGSNAGNWDTFITKYDAAGNLQWSRQLGTSGRDHSVSVAADGLGNVFHAGSTEGSLAALNAGNSDAFVANYSADGDLLWTRQLGTSGNDSLTGLSADGLGNIYLSGRTSGSLDGTHHGGILDAFVAKYSAAGDLLWTRQFGTSADDQATGISADNLGNVYLAGETRGALGGEPSGGWDAFVAKYDAAGNLHWARQFGSSADDRGGGISSDGLGNILLSGQTSGALFGAHTGETDAWVALFRDTAIPGDTNGDSLVDLADLNNVRNHFGGTGLGDTNADGVVDLEDLNAVRNHFGAGNSTSVPEPSALGLLAMGVGGCCAIRRGWRGRIQLLMAAVLLATGSIHVARAQTLDWVRQFGTSEEEEARGVTADGLGSVFVVGSTRGDLGGPTLGGSDAFLRKYDATGALEWTRQFGTDEYDSGNAIATDGLGCIYVTGATEGSLGGGDAKVGGTYLAKYDEKGAVQWFRQFGEGKNSTNYDVSVDSLGNVFMAFETTQNFGGGEFDTDVFISKLDASGTQIWTRQQATDEYKEFVNAVESDDLGNVYMSGRRVVRDNSNESGPSFFTKYSSEGAVVWSQAFEARDISADTLGNVYVTGGTFDPEYDVLVAKYDVTGALVWSRQFGSPGSELGYGIVATDGGDIYVTGSTNGELASPPLGRSDVFLAKFDADGTHHWSRQFGTTSNEQSYRVSADEQGNLFIAGYTAGSLGGANAGEEDAFLAKFHEDAPVLPGDTNGDGLVDLEDLNNVRNHFGGTGLGDTAPFDGVVDLNDLNAVRNNFGASIAPNSVPEPSSLLLLSLGAVAVGIWQAAPLAARKQTELKD